MERNYNIIVIPGTTSLRLQQFRADPATYQPMLVNTTIDKTDCFCTKTLMECPWNKALHFNLAAHCAEIVQACPDKQRFGLAPIDWESVLKDKLYRMFLAIVKAQPLLGSQETVEQIKK